MEFTLFAAKSSLPGVTPEQYTIVARGISDKAVLAECAKINIKASSLIVAAIHLQGNADVVIKPAVETWQFKKAKA